MEQVSFPVAIRSMVRFGNSLCGQKWILPKSLRRKAGQSIMDRRRRKKKSKFTGSKSFVIHPTSSLKQFEDDDEEWVDFDDVNENSVLEPQDDIEPVFGYLDPETGAFMEVSEDDQDEVEELCKTDVNIVSIPASQSPCCTGWASPEISFVRKNCMNEIVEKLETEVDLM